MIVLAFIGVAAFAPDVLLPLLLALPWPAVADPTSQDRRTGGVRHGVVRWMPAAGANTLAGPQNARNSVTVTRYRMSTMVDPTELRRLAAEVARLVPDRRDPEAFHMSKSEIAAALRRLAKQAERRAA